MTGRDIPIILICTERRNKSEEILVKLFGIGIYNAIIGNDRSVDEVCRLINKPRLKKEAKTYYQIDSESVSYKAENENDVSEVEIQNILAHFKRLGKNEARYIDSYNNIAAQYNDNQLRVISKFLPLGVRAVLEEQSPKYQQVMAFNKSVSEDLRKPKGKQDDGLSQKLLTNSKKIKTIERPIVVPATMKTADNVKKLTRVNNKKVEPKKIEEQEEIKEKKKIEFQDNLFENLEPTELQEKGTTELEQPKRGRGRPRKNPVEVEKTKPKRGRGRPRKNPLPEQKIEEPEEENIILPGMEEEEFVIPVVEEKVEEPILPEIKEPDVERDVNELEDDILEPITEPIRPIIQREPEPIEPIVEQPYIENTVDGLEYAGSNHVDLSDILQGNKKIAAFVGTSKNGTSFIVNNLAELLSSIGVNVAILDTTRNRNSYYIYTKNEEDLRKTAMYSITNLASGVANGIRVNNNLAVYTALPNEDTGIENVQTVLETLIKSHTVVLIDCDFWTPKGYFSATQEIYLVQTMDVLTIQPLTAFLRDLVAQNILDETKIKVIINKYVRIRGVTEKEIIGGMAYYNDPAMTYQTELFDKSLAKYITIPFEEETYTRYLQGLINCEISLKGYSKMFMQNLKQLSNMVYPSVASKGNYKPPTMKNNGTGFSNSMNNTLEQMKRNY